MTPDGEELDNMEKVMCWTTKWGVGSGGWGVGRKGEGRGKGGGREGEGRVKGAESANGHSLLNFGLIFGGIQ